MRLTNNIGLQETLLGSTRLCWVQLKNIVKLLLCKFDLCLYGESDQRGTTKKNNYFGGLGGQAGLGGLVGQSGQDGGGGHDGWGG